jgi:hypothetical protein
MSFPQSRLLRPISVTAHLDEAVMQRIANNLTAIKREMRDED